MQRLGNTEDMRAIAKRAADIAAYYKAHPEEARAVEARIDAEHEVHERAHRDMITSRASASTTSVDKFSRKNMRRPIGDDDVR